MGRASAFVGVTNVYPPQQGEESPSWVVAFYVSAYGVRGKVSVGVPVGVHRGENIVKVARNRLRLFAGALADTTADYALTDQQVTRLRADYQPDALRR